MKENKVRKYVLKNRIKLISVYVNIVSIYMCFMLCWRTI